ncbi:MAG: YqgE/AlgH family protein [Myxococcota bacterium]
MTSSSDDQIAPGFLIASPKLDGSPFERAVVLMVQHDSQGSMGYIINKRVELNFGSLLLSVDASLETAMPDDIFAKQVRFGGPVRVSQLWLLHRHEGAQPTDDPQLLADQEASGDIVFAEHWKVSASAETIEQVATVDDAPPMLPVLGYSGWGGGQLEDEIEDGSWLMCDFDEELLIEDEPRTLWKAALDRTGVHPTAFLMMAKGDSA